MAGSFFCFTDILVYLFATIPHLLQNSAVPCDALIIQIKNLNK